MLEEIKKCPRCKEIKNRIEGFYFSAGKNKRWSSHCKGCASYLSYECKKKNINRYNEKRKIYTRKLKTKVFQILGEKCNKCNFSDKRALQIDHKKGGGKKEISSQATTGVYIRVIRNPKEYQILCANCNWIKKWENNEGSPVII